MTERSTAPCPTKYTQSVPPFPTFAVAVRECLQHLLASRVGDERDPIRRDPARVPEEPFDRARIPAGERDVRERPVVLVPDHDRRVGWSGDRSLERRVDVDDGRSHRCRGPRRDEQCRHESGHAMERTTGGAGPTLDVRPMTDSLVDLIFDLWWTTRPEADNLFRDLDPPVWEEVEHNPLLLLRRVRAEDAPAEWRRRAQRLLADWHGTNAERPAPRGPAVAYFCMEFGLHRSLPIYAGGLGVLAGDHVRSASDLGLDLRAVGLFYHQGFFDQTVADGRQVATLPRSPAERSSAPPRDRGRWLAARDLRAVQGSRDARPRLEGAGRRRAPLPPRHARRRRIGGRSERLPAALRRRRPHADRAGGAPRDRRRPAARGARRTPRVFHMNEGHSSFLLLELWARALRSGLDRDAAWADVRSRCVFTTHTPVPAGHDRFPPELVDEVLGPWEASLGLERGAFVERGRFEGQHGLRLCMTTLALNGSRAQNAVSALHEQVSRQMWGSLGTASATSRTACIPRRGWPPSSSRSSTSTYRAGGRHSSIPTSGSASRGSRRTRSSPRRHVSAASSCWTCGAGPGSRPRRRALTLGFARRFATYKRATLLFQDPARLERLLDRGVQMVFAGKAHPADQDGARCSPEIVARTREPRFAGRVTFVSGYNLELGRVLTQGSDVWMNTPRRPREASGTSGQKAALNGTLNCSILDGWWPEAYDSTNGWAIGDDKAPDDPAAQDSARRRCRLPRARGAGAPGMGRSRGMGPADGAVDDHVHPAVQHAPDGERVPRAVLS